MTDMFSDFTMTIDGQAVAGPETLEVVNPATGEIFAQAPDCTRGDLDRAVVAARQAFPAWRGRPVEDRRAALLALAKALKDNAEDFAQLFTLEQGRPLKGAMDEVMFSTFWARQVSKLDVPVVVNEDSDRIRSETHHVPIGVVAGIVPWNFPLLLAMWKIAPALLTGNTMVLKPSPFTPLCLLKLAELTRDILPPGVLNVVSGGDRLGPWLTAHEGVDKISFTGSTGTGKLVMKSAADDLKRVTLELGGNDAAIILPDVDVNKVAPQIFWSAFNNSGQICVATKRLFVHEDIYDELAAALAGYVQAAIRVGDGREPGTTLGPIQNKRQYDRVQGLIERTKAAGHRFIVEGELPKGAGYFIPVHIVDNPPDDSEVVRDESFGPILPMLKYATVEEAVARANASDYGLAGSVWSADSEKAARVARQLQTGTVWVNTFQYLMPWTPLGGHKQSGIGVENGLEGLLEFTLPQTITIAKPGEAAEKS